MAGRLAVPEAVTVHCTFFYLLWRLVMNLLLLHQKLSFTSPEKHCKINQIFPKAASIFGQLNSKSVLSQRSINLPNRRSHSSRTKTHSYAYIKQTGPRARLRLYAPPGCCSASFNCVISLVTVGTSAAASCFALLRCA